MFSVKETKLSYKHCAYSSESGAAAGRGQASCRSPSRSLHGAPVDVSHKITPSRFDLNENRVSPYVSSLGTGYEAIAESSPIGGFRAASCRHSPADRMTRARSFAARLYQAMNALIH